MMYYKKAAAALLIAAIAVAAFAGCGNNKGDNTSTSAPDSVTDTADPSGASAKQHTADEIGAAIASETALFKETLNQGSAERGLSLFGIEPSMVSDSAYYVATAAVAEEVLVVKLASGTDASAILACFENRKTSQADDYADYVASEVPKIQNAVTYSGGDYCVFCVSEDSDAVMRIIENMIG